MSDNAYIAMSKRSLSTVELHYGQSVMEIPITVRSLRRFRLMQDDCIMLDFSLAQPIHVGIGDYIIDPIFGTFYVTEEQTMRYNQQTGGYDYSLRFDAQYYRWKNHLHCLVSNGKRMETTWRLTDRLAVHAQQVADNVNAAFGYSRTSDIDSTTGDIHYTHRGYCVIVDETAIPTASEVKLLQYDGVSIISALNDIAEKWSCEWWVVQEPTTIGDTTYAGAIHFGKCLLDNKPIVFSIGDNVESMDIARDQQTFANRIYAYGGKQNVPEDYDLSLIFTATSYVPFTRTFKDANRELTLDMILGDGTVTPEVFTLGSWSYNNNPQSRRYTQVTDTKQLSGSQSFHIALTSFFVIGSDDWAGTDMPQVSISAKLHYGNSVENISVYMDEPQVMDGMTWAAELSLDKTITLGGNAVNVYVEIEWRANYANNSMHTADPVDTTTEGEITALADASNATKPITIIYEGGEYPATFLGSSKSIQLANAITGFGTGKKYQIKEINPLNVPLSHYTRDYDIGTMRMAGEKRIHLPMEIYPNRYVDISNIEENDGAIHTLNVSRPSQVVEMAVVNEGIYPRLALRVKGPIQEVEKTQKVEHADRSVTWEKWTQYRFGAEYYSNQQNDWVDFPFSTNWLLDGAKLQAVFTAPTASANGHLLSGMTFDIDINQSVGGTIYTIIRNEDYGALLPNKVLKPSVGDSFFLVGWNPRAMTEMGLVADAEAELAQWAEGYLTAIQEGQYTITNRMMSDWLMTDNGYRLLAIGAAVTINNAALPGGSKTSRVIGYEYKLDIPYDTPTYIIGETEAFSRLKQIEKQLTKL